MNDYRTDEEQVELIKQWWKNNGNFVLILVILVSGSYLGIQYWKNYNKSRAEDAAVTYELMLNTSEQGDQAKAKEHGKRLIDEFQGSVYAANAGLMMAKMVYEEGDKNKAEIYLRSVMDKAPSDELKKIARVRLARLLLDQEKYDNALTVLNTEKEPGKFLSIFEEIKGDVYLLKGEPAQARSAYERSLAADPESQRVSLLQMKLNDIPKENGAASS